VLTAQLVIQQKSGQWQRPHEQWAPKTWRPSEKQVAAKCVRHGKQNDWPIPHGLKNHRSTAFPRLAKTASSLRLRNFVAEQQRRTTHAPRRVKREETNQMKVQPQQPHHQPFWMASNDQMPSRRPNKDKIFGPCSRRRCSLSSPSAGPILQPKNSNGSHLPHQLVDGSTKSKNQRLHEYRSTGQQIPLCRHVPCPQSRTLFSDV
jgi:hypothetical protein